MDRDALPLVVCGPEGRPVRVLEENEKGFRKTIEQGHLWALHPGTGRLLPFHETIRVSIAERGGWYEAILSETPRADDDTRTDAASHPRTAGTTSPAGEEGRADDAGRNAGEASRRAAGTSASDGARVESGATGIGEVLEALARVIAERHAELPEGSYTTHLFNSGAEKIRKKTGEEAVELILASTRGTLVSESADLVYHLLVLLESEGIALAELAAELDRR
jgi:phosphoribosyl-ATP pyrophosphohydrolase